MMDGLTLGSDHCFGISLCCGQGSPGEGEGAISEVAVFSGRLDEAAYHATSARLIRIGEGCVTGAFEFSDQYV